ncbi:MAG: hypothetical protein Fur0043_21840 [Anaerolineales bacterium]
MQLDAILEVAIGLVFAWLVLSIATMEIQNWITQRLEIRAKFLEQAILDMFKNQQFLVKQFYNHQAILELSKRDKKGRLKKPASIPPTVFAEAALEVLLNAGKTGEEVPVNAMSFGLMASSVEEAKAISPDLARLMDRLFPQTAQLSAPGVSYGLEDYVNKVQEYRLNVEKWFDTVMAQASAWYKENALAWAFTIGLILSIVFNVDTITITQKLWREPTIRQALVEQAGKFELPEGAANISQVPGYFDSLAIPVGWTTIPTADDSVCNQHLTPEGQFSFRVGGECRVLVNVPVVTDMGGWLLKLLGFIISAFAARQGAPFWFDVLKKLINIREATKPKEEPKG